MSIIHSLRASATFLSFCTISQAWVLNRAPTQDAVQVAPIELRRDALHGGSLGKRQEEELDCSDNRWQDLLNSNPISRVQIFCNEWLGIAPATTVVQVTPTITITTSNPITTTVTSTQRTITTVSTTQTATSTAPPLTTKAPVIKGRAANIIAVAEDIISSVIASGTTAPATSTGNQQRAQAESGLANACSCKMVKPTATVTSSFTVPPTYTTVGNRKLFITRVTDTIRFTTSTTVTITPGVPTSSASPTSAVRPPSSSAAFTNSRAQSGGASSAVNLQTSALPLSDVPTTTLVTASILPSGIFPEKGTATNSTGAVVTAIPFSCPNAGNKYADQVVGDFRFEYLILCNTEIVTKNRIGKPIDTRTENDCAAQCSVLNAKTGNTTCQAASFTPYTDGKKGGTCVLSGSNTEYAPKDGAIAIVNTGVSSNSGDCKAANAGLGVSSRPPVDTAALVASITSAGIAIQTPGLITQTADGGVFETYVSANSTDASGYVHWSWVSVSASSSWWLAVYGTSWACTKTLTQTIVKQPPTASPQLTESVVITTIINGATTIYISGSSTRTVIGEGGGGGYGPPTSVPASVTGGNGEFTTFFSEATATSKGFTGIAPPTGIPSNSSLFPAGTGAVRVSFATSAFFSTGKEGVIAPSPSSSVLPESVTPNVSRIVSSGAFQSAASSSTYTFNSTRGGGVLPPAPTNGSVVFITSTTTLTLSIPSDTPPGGHGPPSSVTNWTSPGNSTGVVVSSGAANLTLSFATSTGNSTGLGGIIPPVTRTGSSGLASSTTATPAPGNSTTERSAGFSTSGGTATGNSTRASGVNPPNPPSSNSNTSSLLVSSGSANATFSSSTFAANSTGLSGIIPPATTKPASVSSRGPEAPSGGGNFTRSGATAVSTGFGLSGVIPLSSANVTIPKGQLPTSSLAVSVSLNATVSFGAFTSAASGSTATSFSTGNSGAIPPASVNSTKVVVSTSTGYVPPVGNSTTSLAPPIVTQVSTMGGIGSLTVGNSTANSFATGASGVIPPRSVNSTITSLPSAAPTSSLNVSTTATFPEDQGNRSGTFRRSSTSSSSLPVSVRANSSVPAIFLSTTTTTTTLGVPSGFPTPSTPSSNVTSSRGVSDFPTPSSNVTSSQVSSGFPTPSTLLSNVTSSRGVSGFPTPSSNVTSSRVSSGFPTSSTLLSNVTSSRVSSSFPTPSTLLSNVTSSRGVSGFPTPSSNVTSSQGVPSGFPTPSTPSSNLTSSRGVPSSFLTPSSSVTSSQGVPSGFLTPSSNVTSSQGIPSSFLTPSSNVTSSRGVPSGFPTPSSNLTSSRGVSSSLTSLPINSTAVASSTPQSGIFTQRTPSANVSIPLTAVSSGFPTPSSNITSSRGVSSSLPPLSINSTAVASSTPRSGTFTQRTPSANVSIPLTTGTSRPSSSLPGISSNGTTAPPASTTAIVPPFNSSTVSLGTGVSSVSVNSTVRPTLTTANITRVPSVTPSISLNSTIPSFKPSVSLNSSFPLFTPSISLNSTTPSICPTAAVVVTETSLATTTQLVTTTLLQIQTVTVSAAAGKFPSSVAAPVASSTAAVLPTLAISPAAEALHRAAGQPATAAQISAACAGTTNIVLNPNFSKQSDGTVLGWTVDASDPSVTIDSNADADAKSTNARFSSAVAGRPLTITQALTLCPGATYTLSARSRQANKLAECTVDFVLATGVRQKSLLKVTPQEKEKSNTASFTVGTETASASPDLRITAQCDGFQGFPVSDKEGWMTVEVGAISVAKGT